MDHGCLFFLSFYLYGAVLVDELRLQVFPFSIYFFFFYKSDA